MEGFAVDIIDKDEPGRGMSTPDAVRGLSAEHRDCGFSARMLLDASPTLVATRTLENYGYICFIPSHLITTRDATGKWIVKGVGAQRCPSGWPQADELWIVVVTRDAELASDRMACLVHSMNPVMSCLRRRCPHSNW